MERFCLEVNKMKIKGKIISMKNMKNIKWSYNGDFIDKLLKEKPNIRALIEICADVNMPTNSFGRFWYGEYSKTIKIWVVNDDKFIKGNITQIDVDSFILNNGYEFVEGD